MEEEHILIAARLYQDLCQCVDLTPTVEQKMFAQLQYCKTEPEKCANSLVCSPERKEKQTNREMFSHLTQYYHVLVQLAKPNVSFRKHHHL